MTNSDRHEDDFTEEDTKKWFPKQLRKEEEVESEKKFRAFLYHRDRPQGFIFTDAQEFQEALLNGWVKAPWLTNQDPEKLASQAKEKLENDIKEKTLQEEWEENNKKMDDKKAKKANGKKG